MTKNSTKTTRRKVVEKVKAATYGVAIGMNRNLISNNYGPKVKRFGPHRKAVADQVRGLRKVSKGRGYGKTVRGVDSLHYRHQ